MSAKIQGQSENEIILEVRIPVSQSMLDGEVLIEQALNEAGILATGEVLKRFDTDGSPIVVGGSRFTSKGELARIYQTPYGPVDVNRHVYQTAQGGATYVPLDQQARIIQSATPKFAKTLSHKYSRVSVDEVRSDLQGNHGRSVSRGYIQKVAEMVGSVAQAKEEHWRYATPQLAAKVTTVSLGMDGTTILLREQGYREAMTGTIALYDKDGKRLHTTYIGATPEYGKATFISRMEREIAHTKQLYPDALYIGIADGASDNWSFLSAHTSIQVTDFWHATEYLAGAAEALHPHKKDQLNKAEWLESRCHNLKHKSGAASRIIKELQSASESLKIKRQDLLDKCITYFSNQKDRMRYAAQVKNNLPIGSGVTEAACKCIVKQRLCKSGMKWHEHGAAIILSLRTLDRSDRWEQFWEKVNQYGVAC